MGSDGNFLHSKEERIRREIRRDEKRMKLFNVIVFATMVLSCVLVSISADSNPSGATTAPTTGPTTAPTTGPTTALTTTAPTPPSSSDEPSSPKETTEETTTEDDGILLVSHFSPALMALFAAMAHWAFKRLHIVAW